MKVLVYNENGLGILKDLKELEFKILTQYELPIFADIDLEKIENLVSIYTLAKNNAAGLDFAVTGDQSFDFVSKLEPFNDFNPQVISAKLFNLMKIRRYYNEGNPNNGQSLIEKVWFNKDYSEIVLDFGLINNEQTSAIFDKIDLFRLPGADETELVIPYRSDRYTHVKIRNWWD